MVIVYLFFTIFIILLYYIEHKVFMYIYHTDTFLELFTHDFVKNQIAPDNLHIILRNIKIPKHQGTYFY